MDLTDKILVIGSGLAGKTAILEYLASKAIKQSEAIVVGANFEMSTVDINERIHMTKLESEYDNPKPIVIKNYRLEPLPEPIFFTERNPWPEPKRKGKQWNTSKHNFKKRL